MSGWLNRLSDRFKGLWSAIERFDRGPVLQTCHLQLTLPQMDDAEEWIALRRQSQVFLTPWEPAWPEDDLTRSGFYRRCLGARRDLELETGLSFLIREKNGGTLVGGISLGAIRRGAIQAGTLGYWIGQPYSRRGFMFEAVSKVCEYGFFTLDLHRIHATCAVNNDASRLLLLKAGFTHEGRALAYLKINHKWTDHDLFGRISPRYLNGMVNAGTDLKDPE